MAHRVIPRTTHRAVVAAPPDVLYRLVADVTRWPLVFAPIVGARYLHRAPTNERFELWAATEDGVHSRTCRRVLQVAERRILFRQEQGRAPITAMSGTWAFRALPGGRTEVLREHSLEVDGDAGDRALAVARVDRDTTGELADLTRIAELGRSVDELLHMVSDVVELDHTVAEAYASVLGSPTAPARAAGHDGERVVYKLPTPPAPAAAHCGVWEFAPDGDRVRVTARHTVLIDPAAVRPTLGPDAGLDDARLRLDAELTAAGRSALDSALPSRAGRG